MHEVHTIEGELVLFPLRTFTAVGRIPWTYFLCDDDTAAWLGMARFAFQKT